LRFFRVTRIILLIVLILMLSESPFQSQAAETYTKKDNSKSAILIILDRINIEDIYGGEYPNIKKLAEIGTKGLMNIRTAVRYNPANGYLTIGAGTRAVVPSDGGKAYSFSEVVEGEKAGIIYENITGVKPLNGSVLVLDIPSIIAENKKQDYEIIPGLLGDTLKKNDINVTLLGDADTSKEKGRLAALVGMDSLGMVKRGEIGQSFTIRDIESSYLVKTDYHKLLEAFGEYKGSSQDGLLIIQLGDTTRADNYQSFVLEGRKELLRRKAIAEADNFIGMVLKEIDLQKDLLLVVTPYPSQAGYNEKNLLTPFFMAGPHLNTGLAFSATTRREGIIANIDVAPTILTFFGVKVPELMIGYPIVSKASFEGIQKLYEMNQQIQSTFVQRAYIIKPFVGLQIIVSLSFLLVFFFKKRWLNVIRPFILASLAVPFILLILSLFSSNSLLANYFWLILFMIFFTILITFVFRDTLSAIAFISLITAFSILLDLFQGAPLMKVSSLSYDPIGGSRYYGLGNEYMGVLISTLTIGLMAILDKYKAGKREYLVITLIFSAAFYLILSPDYGSNVGGTISAFGAFTVTLLLALGVKVRWWHLLFIVLGIFLALLVLFFFISPKTSPSHISKTVELIQTRGWQSLALIFGRKLAMNYKLLKYTVWTRALLTSIVVLVALLYKPPYLIKIIFKKYRFLYSGFIGTGVGCLLALFFNDSGIVAAATMMIFIALPVLLLVIDESN